MTDATRPGRPVPPPRPPLQLPPAFATTPWPAAGVTGGWRVSVVERTGSTNGDLADAARRGAAPGAVLAAEEQTAGRGRLARGWASPARAGLTLSVLLRPAVPAARLGWVPLVTGLAVVDAAATVGVAATLKWPNDVQVDGRKLAGILAELVAPGLVVVGVGLNVTTTAAELPGGATSLALEGAADTDRVRLLTALLDRLGAGLQRLAGDPGGTARRFRDACVTLGRPVRLELPGGGVVEGLAADIDPSGALVLESRAGRSIYGAGDVTHLRTR